MNVLNTSQIININIPGLIKVNFWFYNHRHHNNNNNNNNIHYSFSILQAGKTKANTFLSIRKTKKELELWKDVILLSCWLGFARSAAGVVVDNEKNFRVIICFKDATNTSEYNCEVTILNKKLQLLYDNCIVNCVLLNFMKAIFLNVTIFSCCKIAESGIIFRVYQTR